MAKFGETARVVFSESDPLLPLPPTSPPLTSPFPTNLTAGSTVNLALVNVFSRCGRLGVLLNAVVNWSATFTPPTTAAVLNVPGYADITFELLRDGNVIYRVTQTAVQKGFPLVQPSFLFTVAVPTFEIASLLHFDTTPVFFHNRLFVYTLRVTNIALTAPQVAAGTATTTAQIGAVTLVAKKTPF